MRHSANGTVVMVTLETATLVADRVLLCAELHDDLLPPAGWRMPTHGLEPILDGVAIGPTAERVVTAAT